MTFSYKQLLSDFIARREVKVEHNISLSKQQTETKFKIICIELSNGFKVRLRARCNEDENGEDLKED